MNLDPELRKRVEQIKSSPVQLYREAGDYSNRELVEGIVVSPEDIAAIEAVARADEFSRLWDAVVEALPSTHELHVWTSPHGSGWSSAIAEPLPGTRLAVRGRRISAGSPDGVVAVLRELLDQLRPEAEAAHHRMVQPDHYQRWER